MTESNQGPATPGTAARCGTCGRVLAKSAPAAGPQECFPASQSFSCMLLGLVRLKAENASLLESLRDAQEEHRLCTGKLIAAAGRIAYAEQEKDEARDLFKAMKASSQDFEDRLAAAEQRAEAAEKVLTELLRLYDWRFELAEREKRTFTASLDFVDETRRLLRQYGTEKKAAWEAARAALHDEERSARPEEKDPTSALSMLRGLAIVADRRGTSIAIHRCPKGDWIIGFGENLREVLAQGPDIADVLFEAAVIRPFTDEERSAPPLEEK